MIRLVSQFDRDRTRPAAATPTCGACCSCCCCCVVSGLTSTYLTSRHFRRAVDANPSPEDAQKRKTREALATVGAWQVFALAVGGALLLPIGGMIVMKFVPALGRIFPEGWPRLIPILFMAIYGIGMTAMTLYFRANAWISAALYVLGTVLLFTEVYLWLHYAGGLM